MMKVQRWDGPGAPDEATLRKRLEADGYSVYVWTDDSGATYSPHSHADDQSHCIVRGSLAITVEGQEYVLRAGDRDWLPAETIHEARVVGRDPVTYLIGSKPRPR
jgi:quercetin dioxygenase-like cupin family protein